MLISRVSSIEREFAVLVPEKASGNRKRSARMTFSADKPERREK